MHAVPPPMTRNYMPTRPDIEVDYSQFTYGLKHTKPSESETQTSEIDTCESNISTEPSELVSELVVNESNVESQPKVWSDAPIIEEYESDSEDEDCDFHEKRMAKQAVLNNRMKRNSSQREIRPIWNNVLSDVNQSKQFLSLQQQAVLTSVAMKVNTVKPIVNRVNTAKVKAVSAIGGKKGNCWIIHIELYRTKE
ncbi:hypothetical protein Tco_0657789 [Tanacetum coccineum]